MQTPALPAMVFIILIHWCLETDSTLLHGKRSNAQMSSKLKMLSRSTSLPSKASSKASIKSASKSSKAASKTCKSSPEKGKSQSNQPPCVEIVFRVQTGNGINTADAWQYGGTGTTNDTNCISITQESGCIEHYRNAIIDQWETLGISQARYSLYKNGTEVHYVLFNATNSNFFNWFSPDRVIESSYTDMNIYENRPDAIFFTLADLGEIRAFAAHLDPSNCFTTPIHFFTIESVFECPFDSYGNYPYIWYSIGSTIVVSGLPGTYSSNFDTADTAIVTIEY